jgi:hypothetical protein
VLLSDVCAEEVMPDEVMPREVELLTCLICGRTINAGEPRYRTPDGDVDVRCYEQSGRSFVTTRALAPRGSTVSGRDSLRPLRASYFFCPRGSTVSGKHL